MITLNQISIDLAVVKLTVGQRSIRRMGKYKEEMGLTTF